MSLKRAITVLVVLISLILLGTVAVLTTVVQYFGVDSRDVITEGEMRLYERLAAAARPTAPSREKDQHHLSKGGDRASSGKANNDAKQDAHEVVVTVDGDSDESVKDLLNRLDERGWFEHNSSATAVPVNEPELSTADAQRQPKIPRIIHATWKTDILPPKYEEFRQGCMDLHPDYEFKLWSDASSRAFIAEHYSWFLSTFDGYTYPIQRADVIRYFVLHYYGGIYMDLDIGCRRNMDPLLYFEVVLPQTIPVGVSNDLMFAEKGHPFMDLVIHNLITFDHTYGTNYPTVMFSTGPMFLSAQYGLWPKDVPEDMERQVRVLPRRWYGKNAPPTQMEDSFFDHYYGSSWHAEDAGFITFLGKFGMALMYAGLLIVVVGAVRIIWSKRVGFKATPRPLGPIALPYEALPFTRPGTPGSRPPSPGVSSDRRPAAPENGKGRVFYMPVWLMPTGEGRSPGGRGPGATENGANWSQYFSNLSFVDEGHGHRYEPVPNFSRPPSPSNNSILYAPGATHDGAFDGTPLHSIHAPKATRPQPQRSSIDSDASSAPFPSSSSPSTPNPPLSPNPPAYSALRSWGTSLFRASPFSTSPRGPLLPLAASPPSSPLPAAEPHLARPHAPGLARHPAERPTSPAPPPAYAAAAGPPAEAVADARVRPARAGPQQQQQGGVGGAPAPATAATAGHRAEFQVPAADDGKRERERERVEDAAGLAVEEQQLDAPSTPVSPVFSAASSSASAPHSRGTSLSRRGSATVSANPSGGGGRVEEEVDRLLSEMAPEDYDYVVGKDQ
ncbi:hypothetical protein JCM8097_003391 [Rhodosporidiobolus ruineniae]